MLKPRQRPKWSVEHIRATLSKEHTDLERIPEPQPSWVPIIIGYEQELERLAFEEPLDPAKLDDFATRLRDYLTRDRVKGFDPFVWFAEDLASHARSTQRI
jgi:hypothetical protein